MVDQYENSLFNIAAATDVGVVRQSNEDYYGIFNPTRDDLLKRRGILVAVADGMGGLLRGSEASTAMIESLSEIYYSLVEEEAVEGLREAFTKANRRVFRDVGGGAESRAGTTCTGAVLFPGYINIAHAGDSRAYLISDGKMRQVTRDHNVPGEMVQKGLISREEARDHPNHNMITRAAGLKEEVEPDVHAGIPFNSGDSILLCSDGLSTMLPDTEIAPLVKSLSPEQACSRLIKFARKAGGEDNITVVVAGRKDQAEIQDQ